MIQIKVSRLIKKTSKIVIYLVVTLFMFSIITIDGSSPSYEYFGYQTVTITNEDYPSSMYPSAEYGQSYIIYKADIETLKNGDVVVFEGLDDNLIIHRVLDIIEVNNYHYLIIKGDNFLYNYLPDGVISEDHYIGKVISEVPAYGAIKTSLEGQRYYRLLAFILTLMIGMMIIMGRYDLKIDKDEEESEPIKLNVFKNYEKLVGLFVLLLITTLIIHQTVLQKEPGTETSIIDVIPVFALYQSADLLDVNQVIEYNYVQFDVIVWDSGRYIDRIHHIQMDLIDQEGNIISEMTWKPLGMNRVVGNTTIGMGMIVNQELELTDSYQISIKLGLILGQTIEYNKLVQISFVS